MITRDPNELPTEAYRNLPLDEQQMADAMFEQVDAIRDEINQNYLRNNMTKNYRAVESETLLFVTHEARSLREHQDVRSNVRWNETKGQHDIESVPDDDQKAAVSQDLHLQSQHSLCLPCRDLLHAFCHNNDVPNEQLLRGANVVVWHPCIASIVISAKIKNCTICKIILDTYLWARFPSLLRNAAGVANFHLEVCWDNGEKAKGMKNLYFAAINTLKPKHTSRNYFFLGIMCAWPLDVALEYRKYCKQFEDEHGTLDNEEDRRKRLSRYWIDRCVNGVSGEHKICAIGDNDDFFPTRGLDVRSSARSGRLRLVCHNSGDVSMSSDAKYCTLSHCWGKNGSQLIPLLRKDNLEQRCAEGVPVDQLPRAFQEAINVCAWFQVNYLWIDSLCIIQDSKEDWQKEAQLMSKIYQSAWLNISSDVGEDSQAGLFQNTMLTDRSWLQFRSEGLEEQWTLTPSPDFFIRRIREASSSSRAWVHRERQLSRRILHFTEYGMAWECCEIGRPSYATESFPDGVPFEHFFEADNKYQVGRLEQEILPGEDETYARWNDICEILSTKKLTYDSDRWLILSTLAEDFSQLLPNDKYIAGLWGSTLPHSLLWYHQRPRGSSEMNWRELGPSWSWLSGRVPVTLANRARVKKHAVVTDLLIATATLVSPDNSSLPMDPFGRVGRGALKLRGYVRHIRLKLKYEEQAWELYVLEENLDQKARGSRQDTQNHHSITKGMRRLFKSSKRESNSEKGTVAQGTRPQVKIQAWRYVGESWNPQKGDLFDLHLDESQVTIPYDCYAFFITLDQYLYGNESNSSVRQLDCLILEKAAHDNHTFNRYGRILLYDEFAAKMRYQVTSQEYFKGFDRGGNSRSRLPQDYIAELQLNQTESEGDAEDGGARVQGVDGLYQLDGDVHKAYPWLSRLEPMVLEIA